MVSGLCASPDAAVEALWLRAGEADYALELDDAPRPDLERRLGAVGRTGCPRAGFLGFLTLEVDREAPVQVALVADLEGGGRVEAPLGEIAVEAAQAPSVVPEEPGPQTIAICMATFEPDPELFRSQIESLIAQTDRDWICLVSDDCSSAERFADIVAATEGDERFFVSRSERRQGFYRNFERALRLAPGACGLIALCDQDDRWHRDKLSTLRAAIGANCFAFSDLRLVDAAGNVISESLSSHRPASRPGLASLLASNSIPGAACLFKRPVIEAALPFPQVPGWAFHDQWLALTATALGGGVRVDHPLYDYVQHEGQWSGGQIASMGGRRSLVSRARRLPGRLRGTPARWRNRFFYAYLPARIQAETLLARGGEQLASPARKDLERIRREGRSAISCLGSVLAGLGAGRLRREEVGARRVRATGALWRRSLNLGLRLGLCPNAAPPAFDPDDLAPSPPGDAAEPRP